MFARTLRAIAVALSCCAVTCSEPEAESVEETGSGEGTTTTPEPVDRSPADRCAAAPRVGPGRHTGSLRGHGSDRGGACGLGGPDAFVVLEAPRRVDARVHARGVAFQPVVGVRSPRCEHDEATQLLCTQGVEGWVLDVPAGGALLVSVGILPDDPALDAPPVPGVADPLDFALDLELRNVLLEGERCTPPSRGRCVSGTACLSEDGSATTGGVSQSPRCIAVEADTCATAIPIEIEYGLTAIAIDPDAIQTDAHAHSCGGARRPERVLRLVLPETWDSGTRLQARVDAPNVMLALRGPGCAATDELACAPERDDGTSVLVEDLSSIGSNLFLFVELPHAAPEEEGTDTGVQTGEVAPWALEIELWTD